jgi:lysophospholipase L1-like esterase
MQKTLLALLVFASLAPAALASGKPAAQPPVWVGAWAASPVAVPAPAATATPTPVDPAGVTYRDVVHLSLSGSAVRLRISNEFGAVPLTLGDVHIAQSAGKDAIVPATDHVVTFNGSPTVIISAGAIVVSDALPMPVAAFANLAVSIFVPAQPGVTLTYHALASSSNFIATGDATATPALNGAKRVTNWYLLKGVDVLASADAADIITLGDSITDGARSTPDANNRWPDVLARRLQADPRTAHLGVLDEGISGNRIQRDIAGPSALARLDRDVLAQPGAKYLIFMIGINDIGHNTLHPDDAVNVDQLKLGLQQLALRAHDRGLKVYAATLTPFGGAGYQNEAGSKMRDALNAFIRSSHDFDAVIDFDQVTRNPANPETFLPAYDSGDHLHPNDAGYQAMGSAVDLKLFQ